MLIKLMPAPSPIIEVANNLGLSFLDCCKNGLPKHKAKAIPSTKANAAEIIGVRQRSASSRKSSFL